MKKYKKFINIIFKVIVFGIIAIFICSVLNKIFIPKWSDATGGASRRIKGIYNEPKNTIDVAMLGNSDIYSGISTMKLWNDAGISSYHVSNPSQTVWVSYYMAKEFYKRQQPKLVIIDADYVFQTKDSKNDIRKTVDCMKFGVNKLSIIANPDVRVSKSARITYLFPLLRYHSRWSELEEKDFKEGFSKYDSKFGGYELDKNIKGYNRKSKLKKKEENKKIERIPKKSKKYLDKILELCKKNNSKVMFVYIPTDDAWTECKSNLIKQYAEENNVPYIDYNLDEEFDWKKFGRDEGKHLNTYGAEYITQKLEESIKEYNLPNHKNEEQYSKWNENYKLYEKMKK